MLPYTVSCSSLTPLGSQCAVTLREGEHEGVDRNVLKIWFEGEQHPFAKVSGKASERLDGASDRVLPLAPREVSDYFPPKRRGLGALIH